MGRAGDDDLILFDYEGSPCARRVRVSLVEKELSWTSRRIDLSRLEQRSPAYLAINPNGLVPTLVHGGRAVWESNVITEYLDDAFSRRPLYPTDAWERLRVKSWQAEELAMAKDFRPLMYQRLMGPVLRASRSLDEVLRLARRSTSDPVDLEWERKVWSLEVLTRAEEAEAEARLWTFADKVEAALAERSWLVGDGFSQAEVSVFPRLAMFPMVGLPIRPGRHPNVARWMAALRSRASFVSTLSPAEAGLAKFAASPALPFLRRSLALPEAQRGALRRWGLMLLRGAIRRRTDERPARAAPWPQVHAATAPSPPRVSVAGPRPERICLSDDPGQAPARLALTIALAERGLSWVQAPGAQALVAIDGTPLHDLAAALDFLDGIDAPGARLLPADAWGAAEARMWLAFEAAMHKEFRPLFETVVLGRGQARFALSAGMARERLGQRLDQIEVRLAGRTWICGEAFTAADAALAASLACFPAFGLDWRTSHPRIAAWWDRLTARPAGAALSIVAARSAPSLEKTS